MESNFALSSFRENSNCLRFTYVVNVFSGIAEINSFTCESLVLLDGETIELECYKQLAVESENSNSPCINCSNCFSLTV